MHENPTAFMRNSWMFIQPCLMHQQELLQLNINVTTIREDWNKNKTHTHTYSHVRRTWKWDLRNITQLHVQESLFASYVLNEAKGVSESTSKTLEYLTFPVWNEQPAHSVLFFSFPLGMFSIAFLEKLWNKNDWVSKNICIYA